MVKPILLSRHWLLAIGDRVRAVRGEQVQGSAHMHDQHVQAEQEEKHHSGGHMPGPIFCWVAHRLSYLANPRKL